MECKDKNNPESSNPQIKAVERLWPFMQEEDKTKIREIIEKNQSNLHQTRQDNTHIEVKFYGNMVYKQEIREVCGIINDFQWRQHIAACRKFQGFDQLYQPYLLKNSLPKKIALLIIQKAFEDEHISVRWVRE